MKWRVIRVVGEVADTVEVEAAAEDAVDLRAPTLPQWVEDAGGKVLANSLA